MADESSNTCPGYEIIVTVRDLQTGTTVQRMVKPVVWQVDAFATRDDAKWSQEEKRDTLFTKLNEAAAELRTWARGREL